MTETPTLPETDTDDAPFPIFYVGDGPDPTVRVARGTGLWIDTADGAIDLHPTMVAFRPIPARLDPHGGER